jgi:hypothetical protein
MSVISSLNFDGAGCCAEQVCLICGQDDVFDAKSLVYWSTTQARTAQLAKATAELKDTPFEAAQVLVKEFGELLGTPGGADGSSFPSLMLSLA